MNPHDVLRTSPLAMVGSCWKNRQLIRQMSWREVIGRYKGSFMGLAWSFFHPIFMLTVYTFVFSMIFKARWGVGNEASKAGFAVTLFVGMIIHGFFSECVNNSPGLILSNAHYVKKMVFPLEILPMVVIFSAIFQAVVSVAVLLAALIAMNGYLHWTILLLPLVFMPLAVMALGFAWFIASLGVFARDIGQITGIFTTVLMFLSPVFYSIDSLPKEYQLWLMANPLTFIIEQARAVLLYGRLPDWTGLAVYGMISIAVGWAGFWWFQKTRKGFADVI